MPDGLFLFIGNPLTDGTWNYTWEKGRQLRRMQNASKRVTFTYDASGMRIRKTVNETDITNYTYHGKNLVHLKKTGGTDMHFYYDAQNRPSIVNYNGNHYAYVYNLQGDVMALLDSNETKVVEYTYNAWGKPLYTSGSLAATLVTLNPFRYRGYIYDEETGYYYLRSRYYYPNGGRFINADILLSTGQDFLGNNMFPYCRNNPVRREDSSGTTDVDIFDDNTNPLDDDKSFAGGKIGGGRTISNVHGNSKFSTKPQHGYEIYNTRTGDVIKTGISGQKLNQNGTSPRANGQVNSWNMSAGEKLYNARIADNIMPNRQFALEWERQNALRLWNEGHSMCRHLRPRPWED